MFVVKCEIVHVEDDLYEVTKSFRGDVLIVAFAKEKAASLNTFTVSDVCIKRSDVKRDKYGIVGKCAVCVRLLARVDPKLLQMMDKLQIY